MSVYKEGFYFANLLFKSQVQIYPDAADHGVPVNEDDNLWNACKQLCDWYGIKSTRKVNKGAVSMYIRLVDEWSTGKSIFYHIDYFPFPKPTLVRGEKYQGMIIIYMIRDKLVAGRLTSIVETELEISALEAQANGIETKLFNLK